MAINKTFCCFILSILIFFAANAQKYSVSWGDESKMKKSTVDMKLVNADESGTYFLVGDLTPKLFVRLHTGYKLKKYDRNFNEVFEKDYSKEMKDVTLNSIKPLKNKLYVFADDYDRKENIYTMYAAEIDKNTGNLLTELKEISSYTLESDRDDVNYVLKPVEDSTSWALVANVVPDDGSSNTVYITVLDKNLQKKQNATLHLKQDPSLFSFEDIAFAKEGKFLVLGKEFEYLNGVEKKKNKVFKDFTLTRYGVKGNQEAVYKLDASKDKYSIAGKFITLSNGDILFAGFYSDIAKGRHQELNGIYTARIDMNSTTVTQNSAIEISQGQLTDLTDSTDEDNNNAKTKNSKKSNDKDEEGLSNSFLIRNVMVNPLDNSFIVMAEAYKFSYYTYYSPGVNGTAGHFSTRYLFQNRDLLLINLSPDGQLKKISVIPKKQSESFTESHSGFIYATWGGFFTQGGSYPYFSSISSLISNNKLFIFFNDGDKNKDIVTGADSRKVKWIADFKQSRLFALSINLTDFSVKRESIFDNNEVIAMPRFGYVADNIVYLPGSMPKLLGKTELRLGKIVIQ